MTMTDAWSSFLQTLLWISIVIYFIFKLRKVIQFLPDIVRKRLEEGASFAVGPVSIGTPPEAIMRGEKGAVTSEGIGGMATPQEVESMMLNKKYPTGVSDEYYLVHSWEAIQSSDNGKDGQFRIRLWLETVSKQSLDHVGRVTYKLPEEFPNQVVATEARGRDFELWFNSSKEINVMAFVEKMDKSSMWLNRHITLPGRPQSRSLPVEFEARLNVLNAPQIEPVIIYGQDWIVRVSWEIPALDEDLRGYWIVLLSFDSLTEDIEDTIRDTLPAHLSNKPDVFAKDIVVRQERLPSGFYFVQAAVTFVDNNNQPVGLAGITFKPKQIYVYKKVPPASRHSAAVSARAHILDDMGQPTNILAYDHSWTIQVEWETNLYNGHLSGSWQVQTYLDPILSGSMVKLEPSTIPVALTPDQQTEHQELDILVQPRCAEPGVYKVVIVVVNIDEELNATDVTGLYEAPYLIEVREAGSG